MTHALIVCNVGPNQSGCFVCTAMLRKFTFFQDHFGVAYLSSIGLSVPPMHGSNIAKSFLWTVPFKQHSDHSADVQGGECLAYLNVIKVSQDVPPLRGSIVERSHKADRKPLCSVLLTELHFNAAIPHFNLK